MFKKHPAEKIYNDYVEKTKRIKNEPIPFNEFKSCYNSILKNLKAISKMINANKPYCAIELDKDFIMYGEGRIKEKTAIINIWTKEEYRVLTNYGK